MIEAEIENKLTQAISAALQTAQITNVQIMQAWNPAETLKALESNAE